MIKRLLGLLIAGLLMFSLIPSAFAAADPYTHILDKEDPLIDEMLDAIDNQNFRNSGTTAANAKKMIKHAIFDARFAAIGGGAFDYPNGGQYATVIWDGENSVNIRGATGCFAYANYITNLIYGTEKGTAGLDNKVGRQLPTAESLKALLTTKAQAGEHLRIAEVHSVAFISADADGFYCLSYQNLNSTNNIELQYWTYEQFINYSYYTGHEIYLCDTSTVENTDTDECYISYINKELINPFTDVSKDSPYYEAVLWIYSKGITTGYTETEFQINGDCTRAQAVTFLWRAAGMPSPQTARNPFSDVSNYAYYYNAILWAVEQGIIKGYEDGTFHPNETVTRAQFVTLLWRYEGSPSVVSEGKMFPDVTDPNYSGAILWGNDNGIVKGYEDGTFRPGNTCTRGHVALFMYRDMAG